ncbi:MULTISPECIES: hypothetical protein [Cytobacillus]|uniref:Uncharacterized protein n=1 Tax=Cytobacillus oceanisediminis TaxID=665099 RepID=A0ABX3CNA7_9BACI|nr:hypothetical protein [Cytobacillus oceanisediminis]EFV75077.1 hypothetical protein HMPREF1013_04722 [Bacillus sp. 2_A_57_CT2]MCM3402845.1 hypothetical protein [Cytobacillus oceanisediminis]OHX44622.1 hypothetical protein BBV17_25710 [Cytobacillus oceanisediminis]
MEKEKELNLSDISAIQYAELRHALGLDSNFKRPCRKYYYAYNLLIYGRILLTKVSQKGSQVKELGKHII